MNRIALLVLLLVIIGAARLPAPIQEVPESPKPKPEQSAKPKPKPTNKQTKSEKPPQTPQSTSVSALAGTWTGNFPTTGSDGSTATMNIVITISPDGKTSWTKWIIPSTGKWGANMKSACHGAENILRWSFGAQGGGSTATHSFIVQLNRDRVATMTYHALLKTGRFAGVATDGSGTLTKQ